MPKSTYVSVLSVSIIRFGDTCHIYIKGCYKLHVEFEKLRAMYFVKYEFKHLWASKMNFASKTMSTVFG